VKTSSSDLRILRVDQRQILFKQLLSLLRTDLGALSARQAQAFSSVTELTMVAISTAIYPTRGARKLLQAKDKINPHFQGQRCSHHRGELNLVDFVDQKKGLITDFEQAHVFEHLFIPYLGEIRLKNGPIECRTMRAGPYPEPIVILVSNSFKPAELRELVQTVWHYLGRAIIKGSYPTVAELRAILHVKYQMLYRYDLAEKLLSHEGNGNKKIQTSRE